MTTITYRAGSMAADSGLTDSGLVIVNNYPKIKRNKHGDLAGACGDAGYCDKFLEWFDNGEKGDRPDPKDDGTGALVCRVDGKMELYSSSGISYLLTDYYAIGSGYKLAMGAMWFGADAKEAVECAVALDAHTRNPIVVLRHDTD